MWLMFSLVHLTAEVEAEWGCGAGAVKSREAPTATKVTGTATPCRAGSGVLYL